MKSDMISITYAHITTISHRSSTERRRIQSTMSARTLNSAMTPGNIKPEGRKMDRIEHDAGQ